VREIERFARQRIAAMKIPGRADMAARRAALFRESIRNTLKEEDLEPYLAMVEELADGPNPSGAGMPQASGSCVSKVAVDTAPFPGTGIAVLE
jgi:hypothetical protein